MKSIARLLILLIGTVTLGSLFVEKSFAGAGMDDFQTAIRIRERLNTAQSWFAQDGLSPAGCGYLGSIMADVDHLDGGRFSDTNIILDAAQKVASNLFHYCNGGTVSNITSPHLRDALQGRLQQRCIGPRISLSNSGPTDEEVTERVICNAAIVGAATLTQRGNGQETLSPSTSLRGHRYFFALMKEMLIQTLLLYPERHPSDSEESVEANQRRALQSEALLGENPPRPGLQDRAIPM